jgi:hypothetical protein
VKFGEITSLADIWVFTSRYTLVHVLIMSILGLSWFMWQYGFAMAGAMTYYKSLAYTASATLSIDYDSVALTTWGEALRILVRVLGPLFLGLTIFRSETALSDSVIV